MASEYRDISVVVQPGLTVWPGDPPLSLTPLSSLESGDECALTELRACVHLGTHVDAPAHYLPGGATVPDLPLDALIGPAWVADAGDAPAISAEVLAQLAVPEGVARVLLKTANGRREPHWTHAFREDFVAVTRDAAAALVARGVRLVGIDGPSVAPFDDLVEPHRVLLAAGVVIVEGLDLAGVEAGWWELLCLPLRLAAEGAMARAVLRR